MREPQSGGSHVDPGKVRSPGMVPEFADEPRQRWYCVTAMRFRLFADI